MSNGPVIVSWNFTNWVTVVLMVAAGFLIWKFIGDQVKKRVELAGA